MSNGITKEEFLAKYGDVEVAFSSYYKYSFTYTGETEDGVIVAVDYGGNDSEIYRHSVGAGVKEKISSLYPYAGSAIVDGEIVESFYDY